MVPSDIVYNNCDRAQILIVYIVIYRKVFIVLDFYRARRVRCEAQSNIVRLARRSAVELCLYIKVWVDT